MKTNLVNSNSTNHRLLSRGPILLIEGAVDAGIFNGKSDALREFVRTYFEAHENERIAAAVALYDHEQITLGDAARLADVDRWTMRDLLREHGVDLRLGLVDADEAADDTAASTELECSTAASDDASQLE